MLEVPVFDRIEVEADWAEASCLFGKYDYVSRSAVEIALEHAGEDWETIREDIWREIEWRHSISPSAHPIEVSAETLRRVRSWRDFACYSFMLLLSWHSYLQGLPTSGREWNKTAKLFELLVKEAVEHHLGCAVNIGWPRAGPVPRRFEECVDYVCRITNEPRGHVGAYSSAAKDEGVDVVAWHPFDSRPGQVLYLVQCAAGSNWWEKTNELNLGVWGDYIHFTAPAAKAFAFPDILHDDFTWTRLSRDGGLLLDRLRIASSLMGDFGLQADLINWSDIHVGGLRWAD